MRASCLGLTTIFTIALGGAVLAKPPLRSVAYIDDGLFNVAVADAIRKGCSSIDARLFKAIGVLRDLRAHARALGYTKAEIDAYVDSDAEKDRMRARGAQVFAARGLDPDNPDDLCRFGQHEIAQKSAIGVLLKAK